jgi:hypothetical protein
MVADPAVLKGIGSRLARHLFFFEIVLELLAVSDGRDVAPSNISRSKLAQMRRWSATCVVCKARTSPTAGQFAIQ